jgi:hypothetical protein
MISRNLKDYLKFDVITKFEITYESEMAFLTLLMCEDGINSSINISNLIIIITNSLIYMKKLHICIEHVLV